MVMSCAFRWNCVSLIRTSSAAIFAVCMDEGEDEDGEEEGEEDDEGLGGAGAGIAGLAASGGSAGAYASVDV